jgi:ferric-dicitrate binding protein FerR (iron transport regulator)
MQENYLAKWLNNELSGEELETFQKSEAYATYMKIKEASASLEAPTYDMEKAWKAIQSSRTEKVPKVISLAPFKAFLRIAAVVAILLAGAYFYSTLLDKTISTPYAQTKEIVLPDASEVLLNADSKISYSKSNWDEARELSLEGEAFFKVAKGKKFTVKTTTGAVTVLGTQFNVAQREDFFQVTCYEGLVRVYFNGKETQLAAGNAMVSYNGEVFLSEVTQNSQPSWMNNESSFKSIPLKYVLSEFERQHNITVEYQNLDINQLFSGSFSNTNMELALKSITVPLQITYTLEGKKVLFYGKRAP